MPRTAPSWEAPIPPPPSPPQPGLARSHAPSPALLAAIAKLVALIAYIRIMTLLGFEIRRTRAPASPHAVAAPAPTPQAAHPAPQPRRRHKYMDRDFCLSLLAEANQACAGVPESAPPPAPQTQPNPHAPTTIILPLLARRTPVPHPISPSTITRLPLRSRPPPGPTRRRSKKPQATKAPTHALFVTIS